MRFIEQPGIVANQRHLKCSTEAKAVSIELNAGDSLLNAVASKLFRLGHSSAWLQINDAPVSAMNYVMPAPSPDEDHIAWYSDTHILDCSPLKPATIEEAGFIFGWRDNGPFIHCHGAWRDNKNLRAAGHMLPDTCVLNSAVTLTGWAFSDARFEGNFDAETNFTLFHPVEFSDKTDTKQHNAAIIRLRPNIEISEELIAICRELGWKKADLFGLGSLIGAHFTNDEILESFATEFLVRSGKIMASDAGDSAEIDILIAGINGEIMQGVLQRGENAVLMTCELALIKLA